MTKNNLSLGLIAAASIISLWLLLDGRLLYAITNLLLAGIVPLVGYVIPAWAMLVFWAVCAAFMFHIFASEYTKNLYKLVFSSKVKNTSSKKLNKRNSISKTKTTSPKKSVKRVRQTA